jgi:hypothetical protein
MIRHGERADEVKNHQFPTKDESALSYNKFDPPLTQQGIK